MRVLLVEDDSLIRMVVGEALRDEGLSIVEAENGLVALEALREGAQPFDALVTDIRLPGGVGGMEVAAAMKERYPAASIVVVSGDIEGLEDRPHEGFHSLTKPYLAASTSGFLSQRNQASASAAFFASATSSPSSLSASAITESTSSSSSRISTSHIGWLKQ